MYAEKKFNNQIYLKSLPFAFYLFIEQLDFKSLHKSDFIFLILINTNVLKALHNKNE